MHSSSMLLPLALAGGCASRVDGEVPLTPEHKIEMAELLRQEPLATSMAVELARSITIGTVDATGKPSTPEKLAVDMHATASWLQEAHASGRIMEADTSLFATDDTIAQYDPGESEKKTDDHIVVASDSGLWSLSVIIHEAGHKKFSHDPMVTQEIRDTGAKLNEGFADAVITHKDYAFLLTALYEIPSDIVRANQRTIDDAREKAEATADTGDWAMAMQELKKDLAMSTPEEAEAHIREVYAEQEEMFVQFGASIDTVIQAYVDSGLHEALTTERDECRAELHAEYMEHLAESRHERKVL